MHVDAKSQPTCKKIPTCDWPSRDGAVTVLPVCLACSKWRDPETVPTECKPARESGTAYCRRIRAPHSQADCDCVAIKRSGGLGASCVTAVSGMALVKLCQVKRLTGHLRKRALLALRQYAD